MVLKKTAMNLNCTKVEQNFEESFGWNKFSPLISKMLHCESTELQLTLM